MTLGRSWISEPWSLDPPLLPKMTLEFRWLWKQQQLCTPVVRLSKKKTST